MEKGIRKRENYGYLIFSKTICELNEVLNIQSNG